MNEDAPSDPEGAHGQRFTVTQLPNASQRARLAAVLKRPVTAPTDRGQTLPLTVAALQLDSAQRLEALVAALGKERVIVPVAVEPDPEHSVQPSEPLELTTVQTANGPATGIWTSVATLHAFDPHARPQPIPVWRLALAALADTNGHMIVDPAAPDQTAHNGDNLAGASSNGILIPRPATVALAARDAWLPAWRDHDLIDELLALGQPGVVSVQIEPGPGIDTVVRLGIPVQAGQRPGAQALEAMNRVTHHARLVAACDRIVITPIPVMMA